MLAAVALVGCNRENTPITPQEQHAISFDSVSTRAGLSDLQSDGFGVWACVSSKDDAQSVQYEPLLENERVYLKNGEWTYDDTKYWIPNSMFYFFAAYPQGVFMKMSLVKNIHFTQQILLLTAVQIPRTSL